MSEYGVRKNAKLIEQASALINENKIEEGLESLLQVVNCKEETDTEKLYEVCLEVGKKYNMLEKYDNAEEILEKAISINNKDSDAYNDLGCAQLGNNKTDNAINTFIQGLNINSKDTSIKINLGLSLKIKKKFKESKRILEEAIQEDPANELAWDYLSESFLGLNELYESKKALIKAIKLNPKATYLSNLGNLQYSLGNPKKSISAYKLSIKVDNNLEEPHVALAGILYIQKKYDEALKYLTLAEKINPESVQIKYLKTEIKLDEGKSEEAKPLIDSQQNSIYAGYLNARYYLLNNLTVLAINEAINTLNEARDNLKFKNTYYSSQYVIKSAMKQHLRMYGFKDLVEILKENILESDSSNLSYLLCAVLDCAGKETEHIKLSKQLFKEVLTKNTEWLKPLDYKSRNLVETLSTNIFSENLYIIKAAQKDNIGEKKIFEEYTKTKFIHSIDPKTTEALFVTQNYLVVKRINNKTLTEIIEKAQIGELTNELYDCMDTLANIHSKAKIKKISEKEFEVKYYDEVYEEYLKTTIPKYDFLGELERRLILRHKIESKDLIKEYQKAFSDMKFEEKFIHSDAYKDNWMHNGVLIDWEKPSIGDSLIDVVQLINDPKFENMNRKEILNYYTTQTNITENIEKKYHLLSIHNALCQIGSKLNQDKIKEAQAYMNQAIQFSTGKLKDRITEYINKIKTNYNIN